jgi:hypothetical protein
MLTNRQVFDFHINDEFQYHTLNIPPNASRYKIIGKRISANNDTVVYTRQYNNYSSQVVWGSPPYLAYTFTSGIDSVKYAQLDSTVEEKGWPTDSCASFSDSLYVSSQWCGADVYEWTGSVYMCFEGQTTNEVYGRGIGKTRYHFSYPAQFYDNYQELFYYKKDSLGIVCGTPDSTTMSVKQHVEKRIQLSAHPNPAGAKVTITAEGLSKQTSLAVLDLTGKEILLRSIESEKTILDLSALPEGIYFLKLLHGSEVLYKKLVVQW